MIIGDHAGSGKTLAYLLPLIQSLREEEASQGSRVTQSRRPRAVVLTPTAELAKQVVRVCRAISRAGVPFRSVAVTGDRPFNTQIDSFVEGVDVVVATPGRLQEHIKSGNCELDNCKAMVFDEADILLGDQAMFREEVLPLKDKCHADARYADLSFSYSHRQSENWSNSDKIWLNFGPILRGQVYLCDGHDA